MFRHCLQLALLVFPMAELFAGAANLPEVKATSLAVEQVALHFAPARLVGGEASVEIDADFIYSNTGGPKALTARLDEDMPAGARLEVELLSGAMSVGRRVLTSRSINLAFHLESAQSKPLRLRYRFVFGVAASPAVFARAISYTLIDQ
jgi:hypothetical protein